MTETWQCLKGCKQKRIVGLDVICDKYKKTLRYIKTNSWECEAVRLDECCQGGENGGE